MLFQALCLAVAHPLPAACCCREPPVRAQPQQLRPLAGAGQGLCGWLPQSRHRELMRWCLLWLPGGSHCTLRTKTGQQLIVQCATV